MNREQKAFNKAKTIYESALNKILEKSNNEEEIGHKMVGFIEGIKTEREFQVNFNEMEDIPL